MGNESGINSCIASPAISVIVAAFNAESSISRCIESIVSQSFTDYELLIINDGSTDKTPDIIEEYRTRYPQIRSVHQQNQGIALTRQKGIDMAAGQYSIFVDADDWIEPDMLEGMYSKIVESKADIVICDFYEEFNNRKEYRRQDPGSSDHLVIQRKMLNELHASLWNKLIRHQLYKQYDIGFISDVNCFEDQLVMIRLLSHPVEVAYVGKAYYHYDKSMNTGSITNLWHRPIKERMLLLNSIEPYMQSAEHQNAFDYYAAKRVFDAAFAGKDEETDYKQLYSRYKTRLFRSPLSWKHKLLCILRYAGFGRIIRLYSRIAGI